MQTILQQKDQYLEIAQLAVEKTFAKFGIIKDEISQAEALRIPGITRGLLQGWQNEGLLKRVKLGTRNHKVTYSRIELELILKLKEERKLK